MPLAQAVFRSLDHAATKGEARAQTAFLKIVGATEDEMAAIEQMMKDEALNETPKFEIHIVDPKDPTGPKKWPLEPGDK